MPIGKYFKGHGEEVMSNMQKEYGSKKGKQVFYATANKNRSALGRKVQHHSPDKHPEQGDAMANQQ